MAVTISALAEATASVSAAIHGAGIRLAMGMVASTGNTKMARTMTVDTGLTARAIWQRKLAQQLMKTLDAADRMVAGLQSLHAQFPSEELREALRTTCAWRDDLRKRLGSSCPACEDL